MMYSNNFVVAIVHNGDFCNDKNGIVTLPFGAEYKIRLRNKHNRRAVATVYVDNENVSKGGVVVPALGFVDVDGPVDSHTNFKFVSTNSGEAIDQGKNDINDGSMGLIRVDWQLEKEYKPPVYRPMMPYKQPWKKYLDSYESTYGDVIPRGLGRLDSSYSTTKGGPCGQSMTGVDNYAETVPLNFTEQGCTVPGSYSGQNWQTTYVDVESAVTTISLTIRGFHPETQVITEKIYCTSCGAKLKKSARFCHNCGAKT